MRWTEEQLQAYETRRKGGKKAKPTSAPLPYAVSNLEPDSHDQLNKTEQEWLGILKLRSYAKIGVQDTKLKLAKKCWYEPDFRTISRDGTITFWEVKGGFIREDSTIKLKTVAVMFPEYRFIRTQKKDGKWKEITFNKV